MPDRPLRVLFLAHDPLIPSFRLRLKPVAKALEAAGAEAVVRSVPHRGEGLRLLPMVPLLRRADLVVASKFKFFGPERPLVRALAGPWIYDVDDAVMFGKPKVHGTAPDASAWRRRRFNAMCRGAATVVTATSILARRIPDGVRTLVLPTPVDCAACPVADQRRGGGLTVTWVGLGENLRYLADLLPVLARASPEVPGLRLRVVSDGLPPGTVPFPVEAVPWSEATQARELAAAHVGLAPLPDDLWTTGKGGYKIIQYLAAGLPVLASPLEAQVEIGGPEGEAVHYCPSAEAWIKALKRLAADPESRALMGRRGRARAEEWYDVKAVSARYAGLILEQARARHRGPA